MITLSRLNRTTIALNPDLIERVEENPDTVVTLTDGKKVLVLEGIDEIIEKIIAYRAVVAARSDAVKFSRPPMAELQLVPDSPSETPVSPFDESGGR